MDLNDDRVMMRNTVLDPGTIESVELKRPHDPQQDPICTSNNGESVYLESNFHDRANNLIAMDEERDYLMELFIEGINDSSMENWKPAPLRVRTGVSVTPDTDLNDGDHDDIVMMIDTVLDSGPIESAGLKRCHDPQQDPICTSYNGENVCLESNYDPIATDTERGYYQRVIDKKFPAFSINC